MPLWDVRLGIKVRKNLKKIPKRIDEVFQVLLKEIEVAGPVRSAWPNYSKLSSHKDCYHCHLQKAILLMWQFGKSLIK
jgi:mRNA-degrading endonuclease RelE of RelBE toxin-antitoxin system